MKIINLIENTKGHEGYYGRTASIRSLWGRGELEK